jgi:putative alpha-1,2-mannosidase
MTTNTWDERGAANRPRREPLDYVDPLIGTAELGNTFPAVCLPFGLSKWTPQTVAGEHKGQPPYNYAHRRI